MRRSRCHLSSHLDSGFPAVVHHVQQGVLLAQLLDGHDLLKTQTGDRVHEGFREEHLTHTTHVKKHFMDALSSSSLFRRHDL